MGAKHLRLQFSKKHFSRFQFLSFLGYFMFQKFINVFQKDGKKSKAIALFIQFFILLKKCFCVDPTTIFFIFIENAKIAIDVKKIQSSRKINFIPITVSYYRQYTHIPFYLKVALKRRKLPQKLYILLASECVKVVQKLHEGVLHERKIKLYELAVENRMFCHYRW